MAAHQVVTLPPNVQGEDAVQFARKARAAGAHCLEVRNDLHAATSVEPDRLAAEIGLLASERGAPLPPAWVRAAQWVDQPVEGAPSGAKLIASHHASHPLAPEAALDLWTRVGLAPDALVKHVEPLGDPSEGARLLETQRGLQARFGVDRVTVLATGPLALPFRCLLARTNLLDYLALDSQWAAAPGQRLLADAVRELRSPRLGPRRAILGSHLAHSRSPRVHAAPFDRIDLPEDTDLEPLLDALHPHYAGFSVTSPFKKQVADLVASPFLAVNTLVRRRRGWDATNTDVEGAVAVLERLGGTEVTVLGDGGATTALRIAGANTGRKVHVVRRAEISDAALTGDFVWTWPPTVELPYLLCFRQARVAVIAYGPPARLLGSEIRRRGGVPLFVGATWFVAQARGQKRFWESVR